MSMSIDERQALSQFLAQLTAAPAPAKLPEADQMIREAVAKQADSTYLLVQRAMLLEQALNAAKSQIADLQSRLRSSPSAPQGQGGFLGGNPWGNPVSAQGGSGSVPGAATYQMPTAPGFGTAAGVGGGSSFLGNVATTAAGVVAGSFLFQGIESLLGHHSSGWNSPLASAPAEHSTEQTIVNNYYDSDPGSSWSQGGDDAFLADGADDDVQDDSSWV